MHTRNIENALKKRPFEPFAVVMSSGDKYPVRHPENAILMKEGMFLAYHEETDSGLPDSWTICSYLHVSALEPIVRKPNRRSGRA